MLGGFWKNCARRFNIQFFEIIKKGPSIKFTDIFSGFVFFFGFFLYFVIAAVSVASKMAYVGNIYYLLYTETIILKSSAQNIYKNVGSEVTDMWVVINCWSAIIHFHLM